jgi:hypothetical protein
VDCEITECSEVELYRVHGSDSGRRCDCETADDSNFNCELCECKSECAINSLYQIRSEVICRVIYPTRDILVSELFTNLNTP